MAGNGSVVVIGATRGIGRVIAENYAAQGRKVVITGRDPDRAAAIAEEIGGDTSGIALDLAVPERIAADLSGVGAVDHLALVGIDRDENTVKDYDVASAQALVTLKLVGYTEVIHRLVPQMHDDSSIVVFGGLAKDRPYPGSTTVTTINGGVTAMVRTLGVELAPIRVNAIHPAVVGDSPYWAEKPAEVLDNLRARTPLGRLVSMQDVAHATAFLFENRAVTGINLRVDGGWLLM